MMRRTLAVVALTLVAGAVMAVALVPACQAQTAKVTTLSRSTAKVGARLTIRGSYFGLRQGNSTVTFGERPVTTPSPIGNQRWAPCTKKARVISWSRSSITVRVPSMAPGSHKVYVTVGGRASNSYPFSINAATTVTDQTFSSASRMGNVIGVNSSGSNFAAYGTHDVLFENCTFEGTNQNIPGDLAGVLTIGQTASNYNLTFRNCTFKRNVGAGGGSAWTGVNGVKAVWGVHDITFDHCTFEEFSRFSIEAWSDNTPTNHPYNFAVYDCVFEPAGSQCISWSGGHNPMYSIVDGCLFKGYGTNFDRPGGACLEVAGSHHIVTRNCEIWTGSGGAFNVNGFNRSRPCYLYFKNVRVFFDSAHFYQSRLPHVYSSILGCDGMSYSRWVNCHFDTGDATICADSVGYTGENGSPAEWSLTDTHNDFSTSTITGYISHRGLHIPATAAGYWTSGNGGVHYANRLPRRLPTQL